MGDGTIESRVYYPDLATGDCTCKYPKQHDKDCSHLTFAKPKNHLADVKSYWSTSNWVDMHSRVIKVPGTSGLIKDTTVGPPPFKKSVQDRINETARRAAARATKRLSGDGAELSEKYPTLEKHTKETIDQVGVTDRQKGKLVHGPPQ